VNEAQGGEYDRYVRAEWARFVAEPAREQALRDAVADLEAAEGEDAVPGAGTHQGARSGPSGIRRILDVGCGAGQELIPFVTGGRWFGVGIDLALDTGRAGRELHAARDPAAWVVFLRAAAEALPLRDGAFDVVICRLALPYTDNERTLAQIARVLRPGGVLLLKIHHARFYLRELLGAVRAGNLPAAAHAVRALAAGASYHTFGRQPRTRLTGGETFQTRWLLRRQLARHDLRITRELPDSNPATPSYVIEKDGAQHTAHSTQPDKRRG
jgi:SAM-dependent methyltransferase